MIAGSHQGVARENKAKLYDSELRWLLRRRGWGGKVRQMCQHSEGMRREIRCTVISPMNLKGGLASGMLIYTLNAIHMCVCEEQYFALFRFVIT